jgi:hypothetical protein
MFGEQTGNIGTAGNGHKFLTAAGMRQKHSGGVTVTDLQGVNIKLFSWL